MAGHLGCERHAVEGRGSGNSRNGFASRRAATEIGEVDLRVPRDRAGTFEPVAVPKHCRRLEGLSGNVISLYAKGLTTGEIQAHLEEICDTSVSRETISEITDEVVADMTAWQNRPLEEVYAVLVIDAIVVKVRDAQVANRPVHVAVGVDLKGDREALGLWLGPTGGEGAKQWATMLTELGNRGLQDALIVCCDGLRGLPESVRAAWPEADVQTCVVHMVRNSLRYASQKHWPRIAKAMRDICTSPTVEAAEARMDAFADDWEHVYPAMIRSWRESWHEFTPFGKFPADLPKIVYTTNAAESLNARFRRAVRHRGRSPQRAGRHEGPVPCGHDQTAGPLQPGRENQRLEEDLEHTDRPLRRTHRRPHPMNTTTAVYTKNLTLPQSGAAVGLGLGLGLGAWSRVRG